MPDLNTSAPVIDGTGTATEADAAAALAAANAAPPWYQGADAETLGYLQNRGMDKLTPAEAALKAIQAHREAERFVGAPANQLLRIPDPKDEVAVNAFWQRLGYPGDATKYDFTTVKRPDGSDLPPEQIERMRAISNKLRLPADTAGMLAQELAAADFASSSETAAVTTAKLEGEKAALRKDWGANHDANMLVARNTALKLGVTPEGIAALEGQVGYAATMAMFQKIGTAIGEDHFITNANPAIPGVMSREQAVSRKAELMRDGEWVKRYMNGGAPEMREMTALTVLIVGDDTDASRAA